MHVSTAGDCRSRPPLLGTANLMTMAFHGIDLKPLANELIERATTNGADANALMDLATVLLLCGLKRLSEDVQAQALCLEREYLLESTHPAKVRLLAIMVPGDLMANAPLPFLLEKSDIALTMLFIDIDEDLPQDLPEHDVVFIAVSQSDRTEGLLQRLDRTFSRWERPVINRPRRITATDRSSAFQVLDGAPGITMPPTRRTTKEKLTAMTLAAENCPLVEGLPLPLIIRPVDSHAGVGLAKLTTHAELQRYLEDQSAGSFFISPFVDYRSADGLFRKYRIVLVDGKALPAHMGISSDWMIHYLNSGMTESPAKREEECAFMSTFTSAFKARHETALAAIAMRFGLDYLVLDCAETPEGQLLIFEVDPGSVVHSMDPDDLFPYKRPNMAKVYDAFRDMLLDRQSPKAVAAEPVV